MAFQVRVHPAVRTPRTSKWPSGADAAIAPPEPGDLERGRTWHWIEEWFRHAALAAQGPDRAGFVPPISAFTRAAEVVHGPEPFKTALIAAVAVRPGRREKPKAVWFLFEASTNRVVVLLVAPKRRGAAAAQRARALERWRRFIELRRAGQSRSRYAIGA